MASPSKSTGSRVLLFQLSGAIGTALFVVAHEAIFHLNPLDWHRASVTWAVSYALSILWQHALHRYMVFGPSGDYLKSLMYTYACYALALAVSTAVTEVLVEQLGVAVSRVARARRADPDAKLRSPAAVATRSTESHPSHRSPPPALSTTSPSPPRSTPARGRSSRASRPRPRTRLRRCGRRHMVVDAHTRGTSSSHSTSTAAAGRDSHSV